MERIENEANVCSPPVGKRIEENKNEEVAVLNLWKNIWRDVSIGTHRIVSVLLDDRAAEAFPFISSLRKQAHFPGWHHLCILALKEKRPCPTARVYSMAILSTSSCRNNPVIRMNFCKRSTRSFTNSQNQRGSLIPSKAPTFTSSVDMPISKSKIVCIDERLHRGCFSIAHRIVYALSNAGANPNITDDKGNTPLHEALVRDFADVGLDLVQVRVDSFS